MPLLDVWPMWATALLIFTLRIVDVSLGTLRTISVVHGRRAISVFLGFIEVLIWVTAVSQVILGVREEPLLVVAYAAGFAVGNGAGIALEQWLALGSCVLRMITSGDGTEVAARLRTIGQTVTAFGGEGAEGRRTLLFTTCARRDLPRVLAAATAADPGLFYTVERFTTADYATPLPGPTGWRAVLKKK